jgi:hypothetical protein
MKLPASTLAWTPEQIEDWEEKSAIIAADRRLPQRCEEADRRAEAIVRAKWERFGSVSFVCPSVAEKGTFGGTG